MPQTRSAARHAARAFAADNDGEVPSQSPVDPDHAPTGTATSAMNEHLQQFHYRDMSRPPPTSARAVTKSLKRPTSLTEHVRAVTSPLPARKKARASTTSKYAPPSKYAHLAPLQDILTENLICVFVGTNPGIRTATAGHAYAHPSNSFWKLLHSSGCTDRRCKPDEDVDLPRLYAMGNTNIVERPTKDAAELSKAEMADGTPSSTQSSASSNQRRPPKPAEFEWGWQDEKENMGKSEEGVEEVGPDGKPWKGARVFVTTSTSGLSASLKPAEKEAIWRPFGEWVKQRRAQRAIDAEENQGECKGT
ncbi:uracil DNA N-glycosylase Thp1 [Taxawa tesnikishii (nom. ined.)]|nr:uracil DNA N-glycosylase Thp1 [Dothideales sp. JES 119]